VEPEEGLSSTFTSLAVEAAEAKAEGAAEEV
jgi:hypothetical protein